MKRPLWDGADRQLSPESPSLILKELSNKHHSLSAIPLRRYRSKTAGVHLDNVSDSNLTA